METAIKQAFPARDGGPLIIRYADDFAVLHADRSVIEQCQQVASAWLARLGLRLKAAKTRIAHTLFESEQKPGFDFLGHSVRQYSVGKYRSGRNSRGKLPEFKTLIRPSKEAVTRHLRELSEIIDTSIAVTQEELIRRLNPVIRGWSNYYATVCSKRTFSWLDYKLNRKLQVWARTRHPKKGRRWVVGKYWRVRDGEGWAFRPRGSDTKLHAHIETPIRRHVKVQGIRSPFDGDWVYWSTRSGSYTGTSRWVAQLLKRQRGRCLWCGLHFFPADRVEVDHIIARRFGGKTIYANLQLLHGHCHDAKTAEDLEEDRKTERLLAEIRGMHDKHRSTEEPCDSKGSRTVLKPSRPGDGPA